MFGAPKRAFVAAPRRLDLGRMGDVEPDRQHVGAERANVGSSAIERILLHVGHDDVSCRASLPGARSRGRIPSRRR
jgi:hypothetical protein